MCAFEKFIICVIRLQYFFFSLRSTEKINKITETKKRVITKNVTNFHQIFTDLVENLNSCLLIRTIVNNTEVVPLHTAVPLLELIVYRGCVKLGYIYICMYIKFTL